jgi:hypothetical protein
MKKVYEVIRDKFLKQISDELPSRQDIEENLDKIKIK